MFCRSLDPSKIVASREVELDTHVLDCLVFVLCLSSLGGATSQCLEEEESMCRRESGRDSAKPCDLNFNSCVNDTTCATSGTSSHLKSGCWNPGSMLSTCKGSSRTCRDILHSSSRRCCVSPVGGLSGTQWCHRQNRLQMSLFDTTDVDDKWTNLNLSEQDPSCVWNDCVEKDFFWCTQFISFVHCVLVDTWRKPVRFVMS